MIPSPGQANKPANPILKKSKKPVFDQESGFYDTKVTIRLSAENNGTVYYTLDGSIPDPENSQTHKYENPLIFTKTTVIRASALEPGKFLSSPLTHTYLINENITLPVMSLLIDNKYLYDPEYGIYTAGHHTNYEQDWIRPGSVEYIKERKSQFSKNIGIKIHGNNTRSDPQKSLALYTKEKFGTKVLKYPLFAQKPFIKEIKSFVLRSGGSEWGKTLVSDGIQQTIVKDMMDIDYHAFGSSVVVFLNGKYWGLHHIREKMNTNYLVANHGVDPKNIDLLANDAEIKAGSNTDYLALKRYIKGNNLSNAGAYLNVVSKIDLTEYMNYIITQSFIGNYSIHHNIKYWKEQNTTGKWRWMLFDLDRGFRHIDDEALLYVADADETSIVFRNLLQNKTFVHAFASRYYTHLNTTFRTERVKDIIKNVRESIEPEVARHFARWPKDRRDNPVSVNTWNTSIDHLNTFAEQRAINVDTDLRRDFNLTGNVQLRIDQTPHGTVTVDDVPLPQAFSGSYFTGATVTLKATPENGYRFVRWSDGNTGQNLQITLHSNQDISAIFEANP